MRHNLFFARPIKLLLLTIGLCFMSACGLTHRPALPGPQAPTPTPALQFTVGPTTYESGLDQLDSYRVNLELDFAGFLDGKPTAGQIEVLTELTRQPSAQHRYLKASTDNHFQNTGLGVSEFFQVDNQIYFKGVDTPGWSQFSAGRASADQLDLIEPERLIILPNTVSQPPQAETLQDLSVKHYQFTQDDLNSSQIIFEQAQGDLWIAAPENFLIQYTLSATLKITLPDPKAHFVDEGTLNLFYAVSDVNQDFTIVPPVSQISDNHPLEELPRPADAQIVTRFPTLLEYTSAISPVSATLFYRDQLSTLEWVEDDAQIFNEKANLIFSQENQTLRILITPGDDHYSKVLLNLEVQKAPDLLVE